MGKTKPVGKPKPSAKGKGVGKKSAAKSTLPAGVLPLPPSVVLPPPVTDAQLGSVEGVPTETQIAEGVGSLSPQDQAHFKKIRELLAEHLGSHAAARVWLLSPDTGFETTALDAIRKGHVKTVLATLESQWGPSPSYA